MLYTRPYCALKILLTATSTLLRVVVHLVTPTHDRWFRRLTGAKPNESLPPTSTTHHKLAAHNFGCSAVLIIHFWMAGNRGDGSFNLNLYCRKTNCQDCKNICRKSNVEDIFLWLILQSNRNKENFNF
jgi:hypothetical protein